MYILLILLAITGVCSLIIFGVDLFFCARRWLSRIKIGRYHSIPQWISKASAIAEKWSKHLPTVKIKDNNRYILFDVLKKQYRSTTIQSWQMAGLMVGLERKRDIDTLLGSLIDQNGNWIVPPKEVDASLLAYEIMKKSSDIKAIRPALDSIIAIIESRKEQQYIWYRTHAKGTIYVDTVGFVAPFLVSYGKRFHEEKYVALGLEQIKLYYDKAMLPNFTLPCHAYDIRQNIPLGVYGWGRGLGWFLIGTMESYLQLDPDERPDWLTDLVLKMAETVMTFQHEDGGLGSMLAIHSSYDSSITAVAGYYLMQCSQIFSNAAYMESAQKCMHKLMKMTRRDGTLDFCQGDTKGIGIYSSTYDRMPFAQGFALALARMLVEK